MLSPLNRFKQKRVSGVTAYGKKEGNWCQGICQHPPVDRDRSIILSQNIKCFSVHRPLKIKKPRSEERRVGKESKTLMSMRHGRTKRNSKTTHNTEHIKLK